MKPDRRWISVTVEGRASVAPDLAIVSFAVSGSGKTLAAMAARIRAWFALV